MAITLTLLILAALLGSRMAMVNFWHRQELNDEVYHSYGTSYQARRRWHFWLGVSFWVMLGSMVALASYTTESWWWKIGDVAMYAAACWVAFTVTINVKQGSTWHHVGTGNKTDDTIGKVAGWLKIKPTALNGIIIVLLGLAAISRVVFVWFKM